MTPLLSNICMFSAKLLRLGSYWESASSLNYYFISSSIFHGIMKELTEARESCKRVSQTWLLWSRKNCRSLIRAHFLILLCSADTWPNPPCCPSGNTPLALLFWRCLGGRHGPLVLGLLLSLHPCESGSWEKGLCAVKDMHTWSKLQGWCASVCNKDVKRILCHCLVKTLSTSLTSSSFFESAQGWCGVTVQPQSPLVCSILLSPDLLCPSCLGPLGLCPGPWGANPLTLLVLAAPVWPFLRLLALAVLALAWGEYFQPGSPTDRGQSCSFRARDRGLDPWRLPEELILRHRGWSQTLPCWSWKDMAPSSWRGLRRCLISDAAWWLPFLAAA